MGKRDHEERRNKHKSNRHHHLKLPSKQLEETDTITNNEEIICDGEVEISLNDMDCVEVEVSEEIEIGSTNTSMPASPPTPKPSTSKAAAAAMNRKPVSKPHSTTISPASSTSTLTSASKKAVKKQRRDSGTSSEEERWLTAIESGKLEDVDDELKKMKDPKLMTARQRAMYERNLDKEPDSPGVELLMSLPTGYREKEKPQTAEDIQKAVLKSQKRKQLADEKREKDKKKTMERLLKKQESSKQRAAARNKAAAATKIVIPMISYRNTPEGAFIQLPPDCEFPLAAKTAREPPKLQLCGIAGCNKPKVYNCSKTNIPLCSFACYRKNVQAVRQIMC